MVDVLMPSWACELTVSASQSRSTHDHRPVSTSMAIDALELHSGREIVDADLERLVDHA